MGLGHIDHQADNRPGPVHRGACALDVGRRWADFTVLDLDLVIELHVVGAVKQDAALPSFLDDDYQWCHRDLAEPQPGLAVSHAFHKAHLDLLGYVFLQKASMFAGTRKVVIKFQQRSRIHFSKRPALLGWPDCAGTLWLSIQTDADARPEELLHWFWVLPAHSQGKPQGKVDLFSASACSLGHRALFLWQVVSGLPVKLTQPFPEGVFGEPTQQATVDKVLPFVLANPAPIGGLL